MAKMQRLRSNNSSFLLLIFSLAVVAQSFSDSSSLTIDFDNCIENVKLEGCYETEGKFLVDPTNDVNQFGIGSWTLQYKSSDNENDRILNGNCTYLYKERKSEMYVFIGWHYWANGTGEVWAMTESFTKDDLQILSYQDTEMPELPSRHCYWVYYNSTESANDCVMKTDNQNCSPDPA
mmetsp:Transcript_17154/g.20203  ORF Transcript_17154/g.20203 Transcript_17154/m.20203 type:complete len:178 (+) Transcript_17154:67-600(+)